MSGLFRLQVGILAGDILDAGTCLVGVLAVGAYHPFRTARLYASVTTDDVVVADAEVEAPMAMPRIDLSGRTLLVGSDCRTVKDNHRYHSHTLPCLCPQATAHEERGDHEGNQRSGELQDLANHLALVFPVLKHTSPPFRLILDQIVVIIAAATVVVAAVVVAAALSAAALSAAALGAAGL